MKSRLPMVSCSAGDGGGLVGGQYGGLSGW